MHEKGIWCKKLIFFCHVAARASVVSFISPPHWTSYELHPVKYSE